MELPKDSDTQTWLKEMIPTTQKILNVESKARGLIIVNSVAKAGQVTRLLNDLLPEVKVREISGRIDREQRLQMQSELKDAKQPVLVVGTSAVDVGVDFKIHLLIFESSDSATVTQRLGRLRLGRHRGFNAYTAYILIPGHTPWVMSRLQKKVSPNQTVTRENLAVAIADAFDPPKEFEKYRHRWGALQAQGMFWRMTQENAKVSQSVRDRMSEDLQRVYFQSIESARGYWYKKQKTNVEKATQKQLLSFRGGSYKAHYKVLSQLGDSYAQEKAQRWSSRADQNLLVHVLNGLLTAWNISKYLPQPLSEIEKYLLCLGLTLHDYNKYCNGQGEETPNNWEVDEIINLCRDLGEKLNFKLFWDEWQNYLPEIAYLAQNTQNKVGTNIYPANWPVPKIKDRRHLEIPLRRLLAFGDIALHFSDPADIDTQT